jgi:hypothetical protein
MSGRESREGKPVARSWATSKADRVVLASERSAVRRAHRIGRKERVMADYLRVSDVERGEASDLLACHFMDGRLDQKELDERIDEATRAKTRSDLSRLFVDLPPLGVTPLSVLGTGRPAVTTSPPTPRRGARRLVAFAVALSLLLPASLLAGLATRSGSPVRLPVERVLAHPPSLPSPPPSPSIASPR